MTCLGAVTTVQEEDEGCSEVSDQPMVQISQVYGYPSKWPLCSLSDLSLFHAQPV